MPGVLIDDQNFHLDTMPQSSFYETLGSYSTSPLNQSHQMMRHSSFKESSSNGLSHSAPVYNRSQSAISPAAVMNALNYFSPPNTPKKGNEGGFSGLSMADVEDFNNLADEERMSGLGSPSSVGLGAQASNAIAMVIAGNNASNDLRSLAFGNSALVGSPTLPDSVTALHKFLPSNDEDECWGNSVVDVYACDQFRMFEFKVRRCMRGRSHDWTECPFAHPGEKARRRDPRRFHYSGTACPDFRKGSCRRSDACEFAHGVFECWLHPARYRTQPCKDGRNCRRRVCFFAHTPEQLRLLPAAAHANAAARNGGMSGSQGSVLSGAGSLSGSYDGSPGRGGASYDGAYSFDGTAGCVSHCSPTSHGSCQNGAVPNGACSHFEHTYGGNVPNLCCASQMSSPTSTLVGHSPSPPPLSPPLSPSGSPPMSPQSPHWSSSPNLHQQSINPSITSFMNQTLSAQAGGYPVHSGYSQGPCSPLSRPSNSNSVMSAIQVPGPHMNNITSAAQRRHLDRLNSMPALSIPPVDHSHRGMLQSVTSPLSSPSSCSPPSPGGANHHNSVSDLIATIQQLGLRGNGGLPLWVAAQSMQAANQAQSIQAANQYSSGPSPLRRCSQSVPSTPTKPRWEGDVNRFSMDSTTEEVEPPVQRVESGRDLRAKIYGRLGKENRTDNGDTPDLGWVHELVKDEQLW